MQSAEEEPIPWYYLGIGVTGLGLAARAWKRVGGSDQA